MWAASAAGVAPVFEPGGGDANRVGTVEVWYDSAHALARAQAPVLDWKRTPAAIRSAPFDGVLLYLFGNGGRLELPSSDVNALASGDVVALDMNRPFRVRAQGAPKTVHVGLWIPFSKLPDMPATLDLQGLQLPAASPAGALLGASLRALASTTGAMSETDFRELTQGVADLAGHILRREAQHLQRAGPAMELDTFITVRRFVDRNLNSPKLGPLMVARNFGLSRAVAYRLFEPVGGIGRYIRTRRLQRAYEEVTAPSLADRRIGEIAYALGFQSFSAFSRLFRSTYGLTPLEARRAASAGPIANTGRRRTESDGLNLKDVLGSLR
jgi:AraC-like DNA-binding protein